MHLQALIISLSLLFAAPSIDEGAANAYCDAHRQEWYAIWEQFDIPCRIAESMIFPELIRYSIYKDKMESGAVASLYVRGGTEKCDFSIGRFQLKPSFAETLERRWMRSGLARKYNLFFDSKDSETARRVRISRLEDEKWQCIYVAMFLKMLYLDYGSFDKNGVHTQDGIDTLTEKEQVRLAATAYNSGCRWVNPGYGDIESIRSRSHEKHYHTAFIPSGKTRKYNYADIATRHWARLAQQPTR